MAAALPKKAAAMRFKVSGEINSLHTRSSVEAFANHRHADKLFLRQRPIGLNHKLNGFTQIISRLVESFALRIRTGEFLDVCDVSSLWSFTEDGGQLERHGFFLHT